MWGQDCNHFQGNKDSTNMQNSPIGPLAHKEDLLVEAVGSETVVYDNERHRVHCLNQSTSFIWRQCDGQTKTEDIASRLPEIGLPADTGIVRSALKDLFRVGLVVNQSAIVDSELPSRRTLVGKLGLAAGSAALLPAITSIVAPTPAMAKSAHKHTALKP